MGSTPDMTHGNARWREIFTDLDEPIDGHADDYSASADDLAHAAAGIVTPRGLLVAATASPGTCAAGATRALDVHLASAGRACETALMTTDEVRSALLEHAGQLDDLHQRSRAALTVACARSARVDSAVDHVDTRHRVYSAAVERLQHAHLSGESAEVDRCANHRDRCASDLRAARAVLAERRRELALSRTDHQHLDDDETACVDRLVTRLAGCSETLEQHRGALRLDLSARHIGDGSTAIVYALGAALRDVVDDSGFTDLVGDLWGRITTFLTFMFDGGPDLGGTYEMEQRGEVDVGDENPGLDYIVRALRDTQSSMLIHEDEFGLISLADDHYIVVLPGVTDLSKPDWGLSDEHRSVRDLDQSAALSALGTGVSSNAYARMVMDGLAVNGVSDGATIAIVGHSFGADTALDLAATSEFTDRYNLTHVVAAGYNSRSQIAHVPDGVEVLVVQNQGDAVVQTTSIAERAVQETFYRVALVDSIFGGPPVTRSDWVSDEPVILRPGVTEHKPGQVQAVFAGHPIHADVGHGQDRYIDYLVATGSTGLVGSFVSSFGATYNTTGTRSAIDVSVPEAGLPPKPTPLPTASPTVTPTESRTHDDMAISTRP